MVRLGSKKVLFFSISYKIITRKLLMKVKNWLYDGERPRFLCRRKSEIYVYYTRGLYISSIYITHSEFRNDTKNREKISNAGRARNVIFN